MQCRPSACASQGSPHADVRRRMRRSTSVECLYTMTPLPSGARAAAVASADAAAAVPAVPPPPRPPRRRVIEIKHSTKVGARLKSTYQYFRLKRHPDSCLDRRFVSRFNVGGVLVLKNLPASSESCPNPCSWLSSSSSSLSPSRSAFILANFAARFRRMLFEMATR
jgi:hypothetical protein